MIYLLFNTSLAFIIIDLEMPKEMFPNDLFNSH